MDMEHEISSSEETSKKVELANEPKLDQHYWDSRYVAGTTGWDLKEPSAPLKSYIDQLTDKDIRILIPGAGNAYEAMYLCQQGFKNITIVDIAPTVIEKLKQQWQDFPQISLYHQDFFKHQGQYDLIIEQTFFCALSPLLREQYVLKMHELLRSGGKLVGVLFDKDFEGGPPFGGCKVEYEQLFKQLFQIQTLDACHNSVTPRMNSELFVILKKV